MGVALPQISSTAVALVFVLDLVKRAGIQRVAIAVNAATDHP